MQELLKTLIKNPYSIIVIIALGLAPIGLIISLISLSSEKPKIPMFKTGMILVAIAILSPVVLSEISTIKQEKAIQDIQATAKKEGNKLIIHSESKWLSDGSFDIVGENDSHYFIKKDKRIIEVNKLEINK